MENVQGTIWDFIFVCRRLFVRNPIFAPERPFYIKFRRPEHAQGLLHRKTSLQTNFQVTDCPHDPFRDVFYEKNVGVKYY